MDFKKLHELYSNELYNKVLPFWLDKSQDLNNGGYFTCLDRQGNVFDTDKFIWLQGRQVWMFAMLYNKVEKRQQWLDCAIQGAEFLLNHGHDGNYEWYFSVEESGKPLVEPYNIFSYTFATMAFGQLALATADKRYAEVAKITFDKILARSANPKARWSKAAPGSRELENFALPMILCNLALEIEHIVGSEVVEQTARTCIDTILGKFWRPELGIVVENINTDGTLSDTFAGRLLNPGHAIEAMWFLMDLGVRFDDKALINQATDIAIRMVEYGWDKEYGGIYYFMDRLGRPTEQLEWDQKLWWVHIETLISMSKGYQLTGNPKALEWFERVHDYTWSHFADKEYPEWWGYLNRRGEVSLDLKGGKWKGCFHVPRGLYQVSEVLSKISENP